MYTNTVKLKVCDSFADNPILLILHCKIWGKGGQQEKRPFTTTPYSITNGDDIHGDKAARA